MLPKLRTIFTAPGWQLTETNPGTVEAILPDEYHATITETPNGLLLDTKSPDLRDDVHEATGGDRFDRDNRYFLRFN